MRCGKAEKQLPLMVGGDLPEKEVVKLKIHLADCLACAQKLAQLERSRLLVGELAESDIPDPLPEDFSSKVLLDIVDGAVKRDITSKHYSWKPALAFAGAALVIFLAVDQSQDLIKSRKGFRALAGKAGGQVATVNSGEVEWGAKYAFIKNLIGPSPLNALEYPNVPGIYAILHKPDPENRPKVFAVEFIGENNELSSLREDLVSIGMGELMISRADSGDSLYIVLYPMPESDGVVRRRLKDSLIDKYKIPKSGNGGI